MSEGYHDIDGKPIELHKLIVKEPGWAKNVILSLRADLQRVTAERDDLLKIAEKVSDLASFDDLIDALAAVKPENEFVEVGRCDSCGCAVDKDGHGHHSAVDCKYMREEEKPDTCVWTWDSDGFWQTSCGSSWFYDTGTPEENGQMYCHHCGLPIEQKEV
jgi:hypothetical protein